jgi:hypothetical protein
MRFEVFDKDDERVGVVAFENDVLMTEELTGETFTAGLPARFEELRITAGYASSPDETQVWATLQKLGREEGLRFERLP